ncbi:LamG-like jellyroll fold domain-containing protein [Mesorhizobium opportunistum]|uniref:Ig-like domain-containing protein n=1 Tax=Mesorhizobium opportunistum (strain LMG 24607 / HAMBI 3007 / WSM2075) TaxID=536019 RepID=F7Y0Z7_MESOW|nr:LamG-like jellyroll fold domain-containing protein [Mesorhizobium opportunistum]AEH88210.1 hypothetical protein Mesop_3769 [Mesorhizobium opportunistum WSM2075]
MGGLRLGLGLGLQAGGGGSAPVIAPANTVLPAISGVASQAQTLSCSTGTWTGGGSIAYTYQWKADGTNISGATASTYLLTASEVGKVITCAVTATNAAGNATATSSGTSAVTGTDAFFANVKLLLGFDGVNGAAATSDESGAAHGAATFVGNAQLDTSQKKFGSASLLLDGNGDYITFPDSTDWAFGFSEFTIEGFFRFGAAPTNAILLAQWTAGWAFWFSGGTLLFTDGASHNSNAYTWSPSLNTQYYIAMDRDASNVLRIYVDGVMVAKTTGYTYSIPNSAAVLAIGSLRPGGFTTYDLNGWVDEVRVTVGTARYASDAGMSVPAVAFPRS